MKPCKPIYNWAYICLKALICIAIVHFSAGPAQAEPAHGIAMHGAPLHPPGFSAFGYVNPNAPKGGTVTFASLGSFDSLNPLIIKGVAAAGLRNFVFESLMARAYDEPFSLYGLLAQSIETPQDRSWVAFTLRAEARFSDGKPVTVEDVLFSYAVLRDKGRPNHRTYYSKISKAEKTGPRTVKFTFDAGGDREMPLIMGLMPVLPRHSFAMDTFEKTTLAPPLGSGPYRVKRVEPGKRIVYVRNPEYWGKDLPVNKGRFNFEEVRYEYYRDDDPMFQAFQKGLFQLWPESDSGRWSRGYDFPAHNDGRIVKEELPISVPSGMSALVFNTRKPQFSDIRVRKALTLMLDFEWLNKNYYFDLYTRTQSFFDRSDLSSHGRSADAMERELLAAHPDAVEPSIMDGTYTLPVSDGTGRNRANRRKALGLLKQAGYALKDGKLVDQKTNRPFTFEILSASGGQKRLLLKYIDTLKRLGIAARLRQVDSAQYQRRRQTFDFDMIQTFWYASLSPGNEQLFRWSIKSADAEGSFNYAGVKNPAVDGMIAALLAAKGRENFVSAVRALDRVLLSGHYVIPLFHKKPQWIARWKMLAHPKATSLYGYRVDTWWMNKPGG
jgi:peptide/nickel transport system substrate-binding protein